MDLLKEQIKEVNSVTVIQLLVFFILVPICVYTIVQISRQKSNCSRISEIKGLTIQNIDSVMADLTLQQVYVKTAYNCCCSGDFKNDYVDNCALLNCNNQGVRALHFDIYSLAGRPVISTSTVTGNKYKELYNQLDMYDTMRIIKTKFMSKSDPLFLIFSVNSELAATYESMYAILLEIFGTGNSTGNVIYFTNDIGGAKLSDLINKVVICVEAYNKKLFYASSLALITSLDLNGSTSKIYKESDILDFYTNSDTASEKIFPFPQVLFPNKQKSSINYDFVTTGIKYGITFIGMNFQKKDYHLDLYNTGFGSSSFKERLLIPQTETADTPGNYYITDFMSI
jgi:hypothetical protein